MALINKVFRRSKKYKSSKDGKNSPRSSPDELEKRFDELLKEKENLATEVWKLKQELEKSQDGRPRAGGGSDGDSGHLDNYSPNNPYALQRKIEELESQIQDLQEANETAALELSKAEKRSQDLGDENATLKTATSGHLQNLQAENQKLQEQILQMNEQNAESALLDDEEELRREVQRLRTEMRKLREQNHQVNEENISLRDQLRDSKRREKYHSRENSYNNGYVGQGKEKEEDPLGDRRALIETAEKYRQEKLEAVAEIKRLRERIAQYESSSGYKIPSPPKSTADHVSPYSDRSDSKKYDHSADTRYHSNMYSSPHKSSGYGSRYEDLVEDYVSPPRTNGVHHVYSAYTGSLHLHHRGAFVDDEVPPSESTTDLINEIHGLNMNGHMSRPTRRKSIDSTSSTSSIMSDYDKDLGVKPIGGSRSRGKSYDIGGKSHRSGSPTSPPRVTSPSAGLRSVSPSVLVTQHNKGTIGTKREGTSTIGKRPFAPRSPGDITLEDVVKFSRQGGKISRGLVKFVGHLPGRNDTYLGVELENEEGKHDGTFEDKRYFRCKPNKGVFVAFNKVIMVYGSY